MTTKKAAKKKTEKEVSSNGVTQREKDIITILTSVNDSKIITAMLRRYAGLGLPQSFHPQNIDDIQQILAAQELYPELIDIEKMRGWCKIWDAVADQWPRILELTKSDSRREIKRLLKELSDPYLSNAITFDYSSSIYE